MVFLGITIILIITVLQKMQFGIESKGTIGFVCSGQFDLIGSNEFLRLGNARVNLYDEGGMAAGTFQQVHLGVGPTVCTKRQGKL